MFKKIQKIIRLILAQEYAKASIYYIVANIIGQGVILLSSAVFTRMMNKTDYGMVSTYSTWVLVVNTFICFNLFISVRNAYIDYKEDYDRFNSSILLLIILSGVIMTLVIVIITSITGANISLAEIVLICIQSTALNIINLMLSIQSMLNKYRQRSLLMILPNWAHVMLSILLMCIFPLNLYFAKISGNAFGMMLFGLSICIFLFRKSFPRIIPEYWRYALKISVPSIFNTLSDLILMQCDRLMLTSMVGADVTAEYSIIYNTSSIIIAIYQGINGAWTPWLFRKLSRDEKTEVKKYQRYYLFGFTIFTIVMMTVSPELIKILSPSNYWSGIRYVSPIVVASYIIFLYTFFTAYLMFQKEVNKIAKNTVLAAIINVILNCKLIRRYEAFGAVIATVVSYYLLFVLHLKSVGRQGRTYLSVFYMWINLSIIIAYGVLFYFICDMCLIRYVVGSLVVLLLYMIRGKRMINEFLQK